MRKYNLAYILFLIILLPYVSAGSGFNIDINQDLNSISLIHGESKSIPVKVISNNDGVDSLCDLMCYYTIDNGNTREFNILSKGGASDVKEFTINAPSKGKEGDTTTYQVKVSCEKSTTALCGITGLLSNKEKTEILTVTYKLTQEARTAKDY